MVQETGLRDVEESKWTGRPGPANLEAREGEFAQLGQENDDAPLSEAQRKAIADKIWVWEQEHFRVKGPRMRLRNRGFRPQLTIEQILEWADAHFAATGEWPSVRTGGVRHSPYEETWNAIQSALAKG